MPGTTTILSATEIMERAVLSALSYFSIFRHPLTAEEVLQYANYSDVSLADLQELLSSLVDQGLVFHFQGYYQLSAHPGWAQERADNMRRADALIPTAQRMAKLIGSFPFIRGVFVSGSLSKRSVGPDGDIDYFIITKPGKLWLARTMLALYKKLFLFNSHRYFCINYFVDTEHLEIEDKNLFTAVETRTLLPLYGQEWYLAFTASNTWTDEYLPNCPFRPAHAVYPHEVTGSKAWLERLLGGRLGDALDVCAMRLTVYFWQMKFKGLDQETFDTALRSRRYVSKHHPRFFQKKVLDLHAEKMRRFFSGLR